MAVLSRQSGIQEWLDTEVRGSASVQGNITGGTAIENLHVLRIETRVHFTDLPASCDVYVASERYLDEQQHGGSVYRRTIPSGVLGLTSALEVNAIQLSNPTSPSVFVYHDHTPLSGAGDETHQVYYIVEDKTSNPSVWSYAKHDYIVRRFNCFDAAIDTRKSFGDPNLEGVIEPDGNAAPRFVRFGPWVYRGGLFAGHMPWQTTSDRSGTARIQFYYDTGSHPADARTLTLFNSYAFAEQMSLTLGAFFPLSTDDHLFPNETDLSVLEQSVSWNTRWLTVEPGESGDQNEYNKQAVCTVDTFITSDFANFQLQQYDQNGNEIEGADTYSGNRICVALADEAEQTPLVTKAWHYFASREYDSLFQSGPRSNSRPRVWTLYKHSYSGFQSE